MNATIINEDCLTWFQRQPDASVALVFGSPPYAGKGERYPGKPQKWTTEGWVEWMTEVTTEAVRVSKGYVFWVANGFVKKGRYEPACEGLIWELHKLGIICDRPAIWHKNAPPNRLDYLGNDWEYVLAFKHARKVVPFNWEAIAAPPKYKNGGRFRQRDKNGERRLGGDYPQGKLARPRDVFRVTVGGGHLGSKLGHLNEAPFPEKLVEPFVLAFSDPGDLVVDPFSGSGTTASVAVRLGRSAIGVDHRDCQVRLSEHRLDDN